MKIVVLGGGLSSERQVSLVTSVSVCKALRSIGHQAIFVDLFFGLENYNGTLEDIFDLQDDLCPDVSIGLEAPDISEIKMARRTGGVSKIGDRVLDVCKIADCVFLGLHGEDGEDGRIQACFDLLGINYTGSGMLGSALGMDKQYTKQIMCCNNIPTAKYTTNVPCVVKEANGGSSIGTWICKTEEELKQALYHVRSKYIIEEYVEGREFTVPILGDRALEVIEIVAPEGNFDYISKYQGGSIGAKEICPAVIDMELREKLQSLAYRLHTALGLKVYSRVDFIVDKNNCPYCLEVNTLPGMTPNSLIPKAAKETGYTYASLCEEIIKLSLEGNIC